MSSIFIYLNVDIIDLDLKEIQERKKKKTDSFCELILKLDNPKNIFFSVLTWGRSRTCFFSRLQGHDCWIFFDKWSARPWQNPSFNFAIKSSQFRAGRFCSTAAQLSPKVNYTPHTATIHFDRVLTRMKKMSQFDNNLEGLSSTKEKPCPFSIKNTIIKHML